MTGPASRRSFLSGLATLPLIGGSVALIGSPSAVAEPVNDMLLETYDTWLFYERRWLQWERYGSRSEINPDDRFAILDRSTGRAFDYVSMINEAGRYHGREGESPASSRAALILSAAGCDWRKGRL